MFRTMMAAGLLTLTVFGSAQAEIAVRFEEGAPKDRFSFENRSSCALRSARLKLDMTRSNGGLVFDVTDAGAGVEVFQPFEIVEGGDRLIRVPDVKDGDASLVLDIAEWPAGARIAFTIDIDDTKKAREITVSDAEIAGATIALSAAGTRTNATFEGPSVTLATPPCP